MGATLTSTKPAATYKSLLQIGTTANQEIETDVLHVIEDGVGGDTSLSLAKTGSTIGAAFAGNVGIGTATPACQTTGTILHIHDGNNTPALLNLSGGTGADGNTIGQIHFSDPDNTDETFARIDGATDGTDGGQLSFLTQASSGALSEAMIILEDGKVGIGTSSPDYNFEIEVSGTFSKMAQTVYRDSDKGNYQDMFFSRGTVGSPAVVQDGDELFTLRAFGYNADGTAFDQAGAIIFSVDGTPSSASDSSDMPGRIEFWTSPDGTETPTEKMVIKADGNVGIGTSSPSDSKLSVTGIQNGDFGVYISNTTVSSTAESLCYLYGNVDNWHTHLLRVHQDHVGDDAEFIALFRNDGDGGVIEIENYGTGDSILDDSGAKLTAAGVFTDASDINRKNTIIDNPYGLDIINKLKARKFKWNVDNSDDLGFISQEVEEFLPEIVDGEDAKEVEYEADLAVEAKEAVLDRDGNVVEEAIEAKDAVMGTKLSGGKTLNYNGIISVLVNAVQELSAEVEKLKA